MTAVTAARRVDWEWDRGFDWERIVERRTTSGVVLPIGAPARLELRPVGVGSAATAVLTATGAAEPDGTVTLRVVGETTQTLPLERYQHRVSVTDVATGRPLLLLRGYVTLLDQTGDTG